MPEPFYRIEMCAAVLLYGCSVCGIETGADQRAGGETEPAAPVTIEAADPVNTGLFKTISDYRDAVTAAEFEQGAYGEELAEHLLALGNAFHNADQHEDALEVLRRAWHINRINQGLYNLNQLPILELILQNQAALQDWEGVSDSYDFVHWVYRRNFEANDPALLPVLKKLRAWHISAYYFDSGRTLTDHFYAADAIYKQAIRIVEAQTGDPVQAMCFWHRECCADADLESARQCARGRRGRHVIPPDALQRPETEIERGTYGR